MPRAILTKYLGPTDAHGSRVKATSYETSVIIPYDSGVSDFEAHANAVRQFCARLGWKGTLVGGETKEGWVFVFTAESGGQEVEVTP